MSARAIDVVACYDPSIDAPGKVEWAVRRGPSNFTNQTWVASSVSNQQIMWSCPPPSPNVFVSPYVMIQIPMQYVLTFRAPVVGANPTAAESFTALNYAKGIFNSKDGGAPRCAPIASMTESVNLTLNSSQISTQISNYVHEFLRYTPGPEVLEKQSIAALALDQSQSYPQLTASGRDPMRGYLDSDYSSIGRGSFVPAILAADIAFVSVAAGVGTFTCTKTILLSEYLMIPPFFFMGKPVHQGLFGLRSMELSLQFGTLMRSWSQKSFTVTPATTTNVTGIGELGAWSSVVSMTAAIGDRSACKLFVEYSSPGLLQEVPRSNVYGFHENTAYARSYGPIPPPGGRLGANIATITSDALSLRVIPEKLYICVRRLKAQRDQNPAISFSAGVAPGAPVPPRAAGAPDQFPGWYFEDAYCEITNVSINFGNRHGLIAGASQQQLYQMSSDNGLSDVFPAFKDHIGSVVCLAFGKQIELTSPSEAPGVAGTFRMQAVVTCARLLPDMFDGVDTANDANQPQWELVLITQTAGILQIYSETSSIQIGVVNEQQVLAARGNPDLSAADVAELPQGGFGVGSLVKRVTPIGRSILDVADNFSSLVGDGSTHGPMEMSGGARLGGALMGGARKRHGCGLEGGTLEGGELVLAPGSRLNGGSAKRQKRGGAVMTKDDLRRLASRGFQ